MEVEMADERKPERMTEEEIRQADDGPLDKPATGPHGEPGIPRLEPLPQPVEVPPVPGQRKNPHPTT
jgi:hypothetical protein